MNRARLGLAALIALAACQVWGLDPSAPLSQFSHEVWISDSGLPQNPITTIFQTRDGYLWLGTQAGTSARDTTAGIGLANTRRRLEALYTGRHRLDLAPAPGGGAEVRPRIPLALAKARVGAAAPAPAIISRASGRATRQPRRLFARTSSDVSP